jgi:hypothetical protein
LIPTDLPEQPFALGGFTSKGEENVLSKLSGCDVVFLGEHHDSQKDHDLQVLPQCCPQHSVLMAWLTPPASESAEGQSKPF